MSERGTHEPYFGYNALVDYLQIYNNKSYRSFLELNRNTIISSILSSTTRFSWNDLDNLWAGRFICEGTKFDTSLDKKPIVDTINREGDEIGEYDYNNPPPSRRSVISSPYFLHQNNVRARLKRFAYKVIFYDAPQQIPEEVDTQESVLCGVCLDEINPQISKPITILVCGHYNCLEQGSSSDVHCTVCHGKNSNNNASSTCSELPVISQSSDSTIETYSDEENDIGSVDPNLVQNVIPSETDLDNIPKQVVNITSVTPNLSEIEQSSESASSICTETKSLEDREVDEFLVERHNEQISNEIRERNREKKFRSQDLSSDNISQSNKNKVQKFMLEVSENSSPQLQYTDSIISEGGTANGNVDMDVTSTTPNETKFQPSNTNFTLLYEKLCDAIILADRKTQEAIVCYCLFGKALIQRRNEIASEKQVDPESNAVSRILNKEVKAQLPADTSDSLLRKRIEKAKKLYKLFDAIDNVSFDYSIQIELHSDEKNPEHVTQLCEPSPRTYTEETGLDPWIKSETSESSQIKKDTDNYTRHDGIIKISKFPEEKSIILDAVHKRFPFLSYTNSNAWHRDVFKYTDSEAKCPICKEIHTRYCIWGDWSCLGKDDHYYLNCSFRIDQKKIIIAKQIS
ncbi:11461_t:CDS:2 [Diversispora eburnea]|uniref:11461_t:CDS:1 n=1 Tax=Diversispora eburnea TaxID=1213867 RepID=A0A9N9FXK2_9GLOM|nr:11461_t:CDS:2 [Diversispora eburnea]